MLKFFFVEMRQCILQKIKKNIDTSQRETDSGSGCWKRILEADVGNGCWKRILDF